MRRTLVTAAALAASLACASMALGGTISGQVFQDYNSNGVKNVGAFTSGSDVTATDTAVSGVTVRAFDSSGNKVGETTSAGDGSYTLSHSATGTVRVEFSTPTGYQTSFAGASGTASGTSIQFVPADSTNVDYAVSKPGEYCQNNPDLVTCMAPAATVMTALPNRYGGISVPAAFGGAQSFDQRGVEDGDGSETALLKTDVSTITGVSNLGSVFGVGVDRSGFAYFGTYVKRHSPYGPAGATNAIYRVNRATGATTTFTTLGSETLPAHSAVAPPGYPAYSQDGRRNVTNPANSAYSNVYTQVGRAGIGDVDVTPDGSTLLAVEMTQAAPKLWFVPTADPSAKTSLAIPTTLATFDSVPCVGTFHPMGIGVKGERILVGGVCGGDETRWVDPGTLRTEAAAFVLELNADRTAFTTVAAAGLGYDKGSAYLGEYLSAWNFGTASTDRVTGLWRNWKDDAAPSWLPNTPSFPAWSEPMLANIEIMDDGDLVLALRDRFQDQMKVNAVSYEWNGTDPSPAEESYNAIGAGQLLRMCTKAGGGYEREAGGTCNGVTGGGMTAGSPFILSASGNPAASPGYYAAGWYQSDYNGMGTPVDCTVGPKCQLHPYTALGGIATMPGSPVLWANVYDVNKYYQQGIRAFGACPTRGASVGTCGPAGAADGAMIGGAVVEDSTDPVPPEVKFRKGNGLGDLEMACDAAPVQIGNRVWLDLNYNGIQDADEAPVPGVTARLYDDAGTLVGTALTDAKGQYYFSSNVTKPATGDGGNIGGGLAAGKTFTVKFDNPADYTGSGPLAPYKLTIADATATGDAQSGAVNSKATMVAGFPQIAIPSRQAGFNNHTFDVGFYDPTNVPASVTPVGMGDYTWIDVNRNGIQDPGEPPLPGVKVELLTPTGAQATDFNGNPVAAVTTNAKGYYFIGNLRPGNYMARFTIPTGYAFTKAGAGVPGTDSNPNSINGFVGTTPVFTIAGSVTGNTTAFSGNPQALFANLTIDAGVVPVVAIGNFVWFDANKNGVQDKREKPVKGAKVYLLNPDGTRAKDAYGKPVAVATTNAKGRYLFQGLQPGDYRVKFVYPKGYSGTVTGRGTFKNGSNPTVSPLTPRVGLTAKFTVYDTARGNTLPQLDPKVNAKFIDPTIDAGLIPYGDGPQGVVG